MANDALHADTTDSDAFAGSGSAGSPSPTDVVLDLIKTVFQEGKVVEGFQRCLADEYIQHNPDVADGRDAAIEFFTGLWAQIPNFHYEIRHLLATDDLVCVHAFANNGSDNGAAIFDLFRVRDGRVVEHWDAVQMIPEKAANAHPMF